MENQLWQRVLLIVKFNSAKCSVCNENVLGELNSTFRVLKSKKIRLELANTVFRLLESTCASHKTNINAVYLAVCLLLDQTSQGEYFCGVSGCVAGFISGNFSFESRNSTATSNQLHFAALIIRCKIKALNIQRYKL